METLGIITPSKFTAEGRMLLDGALTVTLTSRATLHHVTLRIRCTDSAGEDTVRWVEASQVTIESPDGLRIGTFYPLLGEMAWNPRADAATRWAARAVLRWCANEFPTLRLQALIDSEDYATV